MQLLPGRIELSRSALRCTRGHAIHFVSRSRTTRSWNGRRDGFVRHLRAGFGSNKMLPASEQRIRVAKQSRLRKPQRDNFAIKSTPWIPQSPGAGGAVEGETARRHASCGIGDSAGS